MTFDVDGFVDEIRRLAAQSDSNDRLRAYLTSLVSDNQQMASFVPEDGEDETLLFEDATVSIWRCRFVPGVVIPPHEHLLNAHIATYAGVEKNLLLRRTAHGFVHDRTHRVCAGEVLSLDADCIHAVTADGERPSHALHVYLGPLSKMKRSLFDWQTADKIAFSEENFEALKRPEEMLPPGFVS